MRLIELASSAGCTYSRYADDLTFSTNRTEFPLEIAVHMNRQSDDPHLWMPSRKLRRQIERVGFKINDTKTRMMYRQSRQTVTGLVVNQKVNVRSEYRRTVRAMVHQLITNGEFEAYHAVGSQETSSVSKRPGSLDELRVRESSLIEIIATDVAADALKRQLEVSATVTTTASGVRIEVSDEKEVDAVIAALRSVNGKLVSVQPVRQSLEDLFLD